MEDEKKAGSILLLAGRGRRSGLVRIGRLLLLMRQLAGSHRSIAIVVHDLNTAVAGTREHS